MTFGELRAALDDLTKHHGFNDYSLVFVPGITSDGLSADIDTVIRIETTHATGGLAVLIVSESDDQTTDVIASDEDEDGERQLRGVSRMSLRST